MKLFKVSRIVAFAVFFSALAFTMGSCEKDDELISAGTGTVTGVVTDGDGQPVPDVTVTISGVNEEDITATTGNDGSYTVENVSIKTHAVKFSKEGWLTISVTVTAKDFNENNVAEANASMINASASITGIVRDARNNDEPLEGVTVTTGITGTVTTGADGIFTIKNLIEDDYTVTFTKEGYNEIVRNITPDNFVDGVVTLEIRMGSDELLRGLTADDLLDADKWYYNEYRGGGNADAYPHWDWACNYLSSMSFQGNWEEQWEGTTIRIRNDGEERNNPADTVMFDSYTYGSKLITEDNRIMSLRLRTHNADESAPAYFGVQVVDLSADQPAAVKVGNTKTYGSGDYADFEFDLGEYVGKEVIIAVGIYRVETGDYWKQLVLRAIRFADRKVENWDWLPGTEVVDGWKLTQETVRSTMVHTKNSFTGISPISAGRDVDMNNGYPAAYQAWREVSHVGHEWSFVPLKKDPEVFASEGYLIKTRGTPEVDTQVPEAYLYAKFAIAEGSNQLTFNTRNFSENPTYFKLTAIEDDGTVTHIAPHSNTAQEASEAEDGTWKFVHGDGSAGNPEGYAAFDYDLSQFNGKDVVLVIGVYNGVANSGENKLVFHSINLN